MKTLLTSKLLLVSLAIVGAPSLGASAAWSMGDAPASAPATTQPVEAKPGDAKPADAKPADAKPTDSAPASGTGATTPEAAPKKPRPMAVPLPPERFSFMTGRWVTTSGATEEHWTSVRGDGMVGMFRTQGSNERTNFIELMSVITEPERDEKGEAVIRFRMRHFERTVEPWKAEPLALELLYNAAASSNTHAVFESEGERSGSLSAVHYEADGADKLKITLKFLSKPVTPPDAPKPPRPDMVFVLKREGTVDTQGEGKKEASPEAKKGE